MQSEDKKRRRSNDASDPSSPASLESSEQAQLITLGRAFHNFVQASREIEKVYLAGPRTASEVRAAAATVRKALDVAMAQAGGCAFAPSPVPLRHVFAGLIDVEAGIYNRVLTPKKKKLGEQYCSHHRLMIIGYALAVWDLTVKYGAKSSVMKARLVTALNRARFRVPKNAGRPASQRAGSGKVKVSTIEQWRKRARASKAPYAEIYRKAHQDLDEMLTRIGAAEYSDQVENLIEYFEHLVSAHRIND